MSTKEKQASVPDFGLYNIENGKLHKIGWFREEYASWTSYGAKIGNYREDSHDFSKVNTVKYKLASQISQNDSKLPLLVLVKKDASKVEDELTIENVHQEYIVMKIINRNRL